jgi:LPS-assembly lipoprotein
MHRRHVLQGLGALGAAAGAVALAGCGFRLRGAAVFAYRSIYVGGDSAIARELRAVLQSNGLQVLADGQAPDLAEVIVNVSNERRERVVVSRTSGGQVRELQLRLSVQMVARSARGIDLIPDLELVQQREISYSETAALAKEAEEELLNRDMQADLVQQLLRRLAAQRP